ncbi:MAG: RNA 2',3'-cyclic phosphodiesterase [Elusimicrobiota bacterium]|nr:RNA 2',3'-cyclic phosphodiesterase [Elusimicrobiota bacterium]
MRLFVATKPPENFLKELICAQEYLRKEFSAKVNLVKPENIHITYAFIGDVRSFKCVEIIEKMKTEKYESFPIFAGNFGKFPLKGEPKIIWLGIGKGADKLVGMAEKLRRALANEGFILKNKFSPHITLGRVRREGISVIKLNEVFNRVSMEIDRSLKFNIRNMELFQSVLTPQGPLYKSLYKIEL